MFTQRFSLVSIWGEKTVARFCFITNLFRNYYFRQKRLFHLRSTFFWNIFTIFSFFFFSSETKTNQQQNNNNRLCICRVQGRRSNFNFMFTGTFHCCARSSFVILIVFVRVIVKQSVLKRTIIWCGKNGLDSLLINPPVSFWWSIRPAVIVNSHKFL